MDLTSKFFKVSILLAVSFTGLSSAQQSVDANQTVKVTDAKQNVELKDYGLSTIGQVALSVKDLDRATAFYKDKLRFKFLFTSGGMAFFDAGGIRLMLVKPANPEVNHGSSVIYYNVANVPNAYESFLARGVKFDAKPEIAAKTAKFDLWLVCLHDPEGNQLCLMNEAAK